MTRGQPTCPRRMPHPTLAVYAGRPWRRLPRLRTPQPAVPAPLRASAKRPRRLPSPPRASRRKSLASQQAPASGRLGTWTSRRRKRLAPRCSLPHASNLGGRENEGWSPPLTPVRSVSAHRSDRAAADVRALHSLWRLDAQEFEARNECSQSGSTQRQAAGADLFGVRLHDGALLVEDGERLG